MILHNPDFESESSATRRGTVASGSVFEDVVAQKNGGLEGPTRPTLTCVFDAFGILIRCRYVVNVVCVCMNK